MAIVEIENGYKNHLKPLLCIHLVDLVESIVLGWSAEAVEENAS